MKPQWMMKENARFKWACQDCDWASNEDYEADEHIRETDHCVEQNEEYKP